MQKIGHIVTRPGRKLGDDPVDIPVPQELETVPGIPQDSKDVSFYSREYPLQRQQVEHAADTEWSHSVGTEDMQKYHHEHTAVMEQFYPAGHAKQCGRDGTHQEQGAGTGLLGGGHHGS